MTWFCRLDGWRCSRFVVADNRGEKPVRAQLEAPLVRMARIKEPNAESVARELASRNITCNAVAPGFVATAMTDRMTDEAKARLTGQIPLERLGTPEDVAAAVAYLASDEASYVTGTVVNVSGGLYM